MKTYGASRSTAASPQIVWAIWSDPNNWSVWNSEIRSTEVDGPIANGTKGVMTTNRGSVHDLVFHSVVAGRGFSMSMAGPPLTTMTFSCNVVPGDSGSTIAQNVTFAGPLGFLFGALMGSEMAKHFAPVLDDLARTAEATPS